MVNGPQALPRTCARVRARVDERLDGGLDALEAARDEGHLEACGGCCAQAEEQQRALEGLRELLLPGAAALAGAAQGLDARLRAARAPAGRVLEGPWQRPLRAAAVAASALLMLGLMERLGGFDVAGEVLGARRAAAAALPDASWPADLDLFEGDE